jgi:hypothetical protein
MKCSALSKADMFQSQLEIQATHKQQDDRSKYKGKAFHFVVKRF